jgi:hypothetical protein
MLRERRTQSSARLRPTSAKSRTFSSGRIRFSTPPAAAAGRPLRRTGGPTFVDDSLIAFQPAIWAAETRPFPPRPPTHPLSRAAHAHQHEMDPSYSGELATRHPVGVIHGTLVRPRIDIRLVQHFIGADAIRPSNNFFQIELMCTWTIDDRRSHHLTTDLPCTTPCNRGSSLFS